MSDQGSFSFMDGPQPVPPVRRVRQQPISRKEAARIKRDVGMERVIDHADRVNTGWSEDCLNLLRLFLVQQCGQPFLTEDFKRWTVGRIDPPPDGRAYGPVIMRAKREGFIRTVGVAKATTSNLSLKPIWQSIA